MALTAYRADLQQQAETLESVMTYHEKIQERKVENENGMKTLKKTMDSRALELEELITHHSS
jgi:hypothetical protein